MTKTPQPKPDCTTCASRTLGIFCDVEAQAMGECNLHKTSNTYKKGQIIFYEGNQPYGLFCIFSGRVKLYKTGLDGQQQILRIAGAGGTLGYRSLFAGEPYHATAEALEDAVVCGIDKNAFFSVLGKHAVLAMNMIRKLSHELRVAEDLATSIAHKSVRERMAALLLMLKETYGKPAKNGVIIDLRLTREELGEMIGTTQETAIRLISEFKKNGWINVRERDITIVDTAALLEAANLDV